MTGFFRQIQLVRGLVLLAVSLLGTAHADGEASETVFHDGSLEIPDGIAFRQILTMLKPNPQQPDREGQLSILATALGKHDEVDGNYSLLQGELDNLNNRLVTALYRETEESHQALCTENRSTRSAADSHRIMNSLDDIAIQTFQVELDDYLSTLTEEERKSFDSFVENIKYGTTYQRIDSRDSNSSVAEATEYRCIGLEAQILKDGREK